MFVVCAVAGADCGGCAGLAGLGAGAGAGAGPGTGVGAGAAGFADAGAAWLTGACLADSWIPGMAIALVAEDGADAVDAIGMDFAVGAVAGAGAGLVDGAGVALAFPTNAA